MLNTKFECIRINRGYGYEEYKCYNFKDMTDEQIINKCDYSNFGGKVTRYDGFAIVKVYTD